MMELGFFYLSSVHWMLYYSSILFKIRIKHDLQKKKTVTVVLTGLYFNGLRKQIGLVIQQGTALYKAQMHTMFSLLCYI